MTLPRDDWDDDERRALTGLEKELEQIRARHQDDPPFELLRAADAEALPEPLQGALAEHLEHSAWSRALVEGGADADATLDADDQQRLFARIQRSTRATPAVSFWRARFWIPAFAAAAILVVIVGVLRRGGPDQPFEQRPLPPPEGQVAVAQPAPAFTLPLDKADVKLTPAALVLRSEGRDARFVDDIAPALTAYRAGDYAEADRRFAVLETRYPKSVEVAFYRGVSQLFLNDAPAAIVSLQAARRLDEDAFASEIGWYLGVAYERAGDATRLRVELDSLCRAKSVYAARACDAAATINRQ
jgi:hypothetical protein